MGSYRVLRTDEFMKEYRTLAQQERFWIYKMQKKFTVHPTGKILRYSWFREKKFGNKRLYFLVDEETKKVLLIAFDSKKEQQKIIDYVTKNMDALFRFLRNP
ncbi:MAG: hypothetical protein OXR66_08890 [Candidatus Woesearchaeota archaeon]|nr:hypothetical protein [Candidatus Woesearchaeota archaeon]